MFLCWLTKACSSFKNNNKRGCIVLELKDINEKVFAAAPTVRLEILAVQVLSEGVTSSRQSPRKKLLPVTKLVPHPKARLGGLHEKTGRIPLPVPCFLAIVLPAPSHPCKANGALVSHEPPCLPAPPGPLALPLGQEAARTH